MVDDGQGGFKGRASVLGCPKKRDGIVTINAFGEDEAEDDIDDIYMVSIEENRFR